MEVDFGFAFDCGELFRGAGEEPGAFWLGCFFVLAHFGEGESGIEADFEFPGIFGLGEVGEDLFDEVGVNAAGEGEENDEDGSHGFRK